MTVVTVSFLIMFQTEFCLVHRRKEDYHYDHNYFNLKGIRNLLLWVYTSRSSNTIWLTDWIWRLHFWWIEIRLPHSATRVILLVLFAYSFQNQPISGRDPENCMHQASKHRHRLFRLHIVCSLYLLYGSRRPSGAN